MAKYMIPAKSKSSMELIKGITISDLFFIIIPTGFIGVFIFLSSLLLPIKFTLLALVGLILISSVSEINDKKGYYYLIDLFKYIFRNKYVPSVNFKDGTNTVFKDGMVQSNGTLSGAVIIEGIDFSLLTVEMQNSTINRTCNAYQFAKQCNILKVEKPVNLPNYIDKLKVKKQEWISKLEKASDKLPYETRINDIDIQLKHLELFEEYKTWTVPIYYFIAYSNSVEELNGILSEVQANFENANISSRIASENELREMYELYYGKSLDGNDTFELPEVIEKTNKLIINGEEYRILTLGKLPPDVGNAWAYRLFSIPRAKVLLKQEVNENWKKLERQINRTINEKKSRINDKTPESVYLELSNEINRHIDLLEAIKFGRQSVHLMNLYIMIPASDFKEVKQEIKRNSIHPNMLINNQLLAYQGMMLHQFAPIFKREAKELPTTTLAGMFPFVSVVQMDEDGSYLGYDTYTGLPIFFDCFENLRNPKGSRSNANEVRFGQSGKGKSFSMKITILRHLAKGNRVLILDPEDEYSDLCKNFGGEVMDMASVKDLSINPFEINASLADEMEGDSSKEDITEGEINAHRQYLSQFFKLTLPDMDRECRTLLDKSIGDLYEKFGITRHTELKELNHTDYPLMDDLYKLILEEYNKADTEYTKIIYRKIQAQLESFKAGGLNSKLWNKHTSINISNDFTVFNFQSLFANSNETVATGQMSLLMKILMQEIIKNKQFNDLQKAKGLPTNNVVVVVDEAHMFINPKVPIALEFMKNLAKRIRKYNGSLTITTQSIRDFTGFEGDTKALATAVINCCQYSTIFSLSQDDTNALIELYKASGGLTQPEIEYITSAKIGEALMLVDKNTRIKMKFEMYDDELEFLKR